MCELCEALKFGVLSHADRACVCRLGCESDGNVFVFWDALESDML